MAMKKCLKCGSEDIDQGRLMSAGGVAYKSNLQRIMFVKDNCKSYACVSCGYVGSYIDEQYRNKIKRLRNKS
jgi:Zn ribbon nucleic-acid-binding protein